MVKLLLMSRQEAYSLLSANVGRSLDVIIDGNRVPVTLASVHKDGALLQMVEPESLEPSAEFWVAFANIERVETRVSAAS